MGFFLKKLLGSLLMPLPAALVLVGAGLWRVYRVRDDKRGWAAAGTGMLLLYLASTHAAAWFMLAPLERNQLGYVPDDTRPIAAIAVLGGGYHPVKGRPLTGQISGSSIVRVTEAVRVARLHPNAAFHCSGYGFGYPGSMAAAACDLAVALGVAPTRVVLHEQARDTEDEAVAVKATVGDGAVVLVTHASHMPRASALFEGKGVRVIPAPCGHVSPAKPTWSLMPTSYNLGTTSAAWHEWLGRAWAWLKGATR